MIQTNGQGSKVKDEGWGVRKRKNRGTTKRMGHPLKRSHKNPSPGTLDGLNLNQVKVKVNVTPFITFSIRGKYVLLTGVHLDACAEYKRGGGHGGHGGGGHHGGGRGHHAPPRRSRHHYSDHDDSHSRSVESDYSGKNSRFFWKTPTIFGKM